ncbi:HAMP domain-containing sensor histidine kinase [Aureimonas sp. ME7]|uniref:sensor histidine kinase n=1 Tax=Aureimonas sp. ME7 TaxID=2744252 RepID=UPI0015F497CC|nr:HAMP domain-containing sensor histidine kinase [Aureimonas sp. ME7]
MADFAGLRRQIEDRFAGFLSSGILDPSARRLRARLVAGLVAASLLTAMLAPLAAIAPGGVVLLPAALTIAFVLLGSATLVAVGCELALVLAGLHLAGSIVLAALAIALDSFWILALVAVGPIEAWSANRPLSAKLMVPAVLAAVGVTGFLSLHGLGPASQGFAGALVAVPMLTAYATFVTCRFAFRNKLGLNASEASASTPFVMLDLEGRVTGGGNGMTGEAGQVFAHRLHVLDRITFLRALDAMRDGGEGRDLELRLRSEDTTESYRTAFVRLVPVAGHGRTLAGVRAEFERGATEAPAPKAATDEHSAFLATVSHELRTPLNAVIGFSDMLDQELCGGFTDPRQREYVGLIRRSSQHVLGIVNSLLDVSKIEAGRYELEPVEFSIAEAVRTAGDMVRPDADRKGLRLTLRNCDEADTIVADPHACRQILINLLSNAVKFTEAGTVCLAVGLDADWLTLTVSDTGIGIEAKDIDRLARPFVQVSQGASRRFEGTGLGLSLVKGLSELHHGAMHIRSQIGRGTTVTVRIPTDCAERIRAGHTSSDNIVALTDARKKTSLIPQDSQTRRSA